MSEAKFLISSIAFLTLIPADLLFLDNFSTSTEIFSIIDLSC